MVSPLASGNLMLWSFDGPGIRTLFLLPFTSRGLGLSKNLAWLASTALQVGVAVAVITALRPQRYLHELPVFIPGYAALMFAAGAVGTWVSIRRPTPPQGRGFSRRSPGGATGLLAYLLVFAAAAALVLAVLAVRALTPDPYDTAASLALTLLLLAASASVWWARASSKKKAPAPKKTPVSKKAPASKKKPAPKKVSTPKKKKR